MYVITDRVVNGAPVWVAEDGKHFIYRARNGTMQIGDEWKCTAGRAAGWIYHRVKHEDVMAPTQLLSNKWKSNQHATLGPQFTSAIGTDESQPWVPVPDMHVTAVHGLDDAEPAMATALRQLAALPADE